MDYDLLSQFDHAGVDPIAQAQAAALLSQQSQIRPPSLPGAGIAEGREEYISPQAPYANPVNYAQQQQGPSNNQIAMDAFAAAQELQRQGRTVGFEASGVGGNLPPTEEPQRTVYNRNVGYGRFQPAYFEDGSRMLYPGVGAEVRRGEFGFANPNGSNLMPTNMAGNYVDPHEFERRRNEQSIANAARAFWRYNTGLPPLEGTFNRFNPNAQLDNSQVQDSRRWRR